jgi:AcrR family transcriptional regulator
MGRVQGYVTQDVVRAARGVFWEHGFESAALPVLEDATGLNRSSIYHAFGSKRGLFDAAVASYLDEVVRPRLRPLTLPDVAPDALTTYLLGLRAALAEPASFTAVNGCLLLNAAGAPIARDAAVRDAVSAYRAELLAAFAAGVRARFPDAGPDGVERLAQACTALVVSALALTRVDNDGALRGLDSALALVEYGGRSRS